MQEEGNTAAETPRSRRDIFLGLAAVTLGVGYLLGLAMWLSIFVNPSMGGSLSPEPVADLGQAAGLIVIGVALLSKIQSRGPRWRVGALVLAAGYAALLLTTMYLSINVFSVPQMLHPSGSPRALLIVLALDLWSIVASVLVAPVFVTRSPGTRVMGNKGRNGRFGWVSVGFAVVFGVAMVNQTVTGWRVWQTAGGVVTTQNIGLAASVFLIVAALIAAVAFLTVAKSHGRDWPHSLRRRETLLALAAASLLVCHVLLITSGVMPLSGPEAGLKGVGYHALGILEGVAFVAAPLLAVIGFGLARRHSGQSALS